MTKLLKYFLLWAIIWIIVGIVVFVMAGEEKPEILIGIGLAALISLILLLKVLGEAWEGIVTERKTEKRPVRHGNKTVWTDTDFVLIKLVNGKIKKTRAMPQWQVGTHLIKHRGEMQAKVISS